MLLLLLLLVALSVVELNVQFVELGQSAASVLRAVLLGLLKFAELYQLLKCLLVPALPRVQVDHVLEHPRVLYFFEQGDAVVLAVFIPEQLLESFVLR